jgi:triacylglycerol esterase/lipase EstA (alpha/beta hydrolase family)
MGRAALVVVVVLALLPLAYGSSARAALPVVYNLPAGIAASVAHPGAPPPGANDWSCRSAAHPRPVVLVHGIFGNLTNNWFALSPLLKNNGYCVFALTYGARLGVFGGVAPMVDSSRELAAFVDRVLKATGAAQVDLVGHSEGALLARYYLKFDGGATKVHALIQLAPPNHGTTLFGLTSIARRLPGAPALTNAVCPACWDMFAGSDLLTRLNAGGETLPGVTYGVIVTRYDQLLVPASSANLAGDNVKTIVVQRQCPLDFTEHVALAFDHIALRNVLNMLDPTTARRALCTPVLPLIGG